MFKELPEVIVQYGIPCDWGLEDHFSLSQMHAYTEYPMWIGPKAFYRSLVACGHPFWTDLKAPYTRLVELRRATNSTYIIYFTRELSLGIYSTEIFKEDLSIAQLPRQFITALLPYALLT